jgi:glycosyltransferase involved in cell wall biosynthesis
MQILLWRVIMPKISVIMSVYNSEQYLKRSIDSILNQTFKDFEFIIINDGSTDNSAQILEEYSKNNNCIKIIIQENKGLTKSLNIGIKKAKGKYIARQDADDFSFSDRFEKQVYFLDNNIDIILLGTNKYEVYQNEERLGNYYNIDTINDLVYLYNPFAHTSAMYRKDIFIKIGLYNETFKTSQDFEAWMRFAEYGKIAMIKDVLVKRYTVDNSISSLKKFNQIKNALRARLLHSKFGLVKVVQTTLYQVITAYLPNYIIKAKRRFLNDSK